MLKKRLGINAIEKSWFVGGRLATNFKIPSTLNIPEGCESIGLNVFYGCWRLREVIIPDSVKVIGIGAFWDCWKLREVIVPGNVDEIGAAAFKGCKRAIIILKKPRYQFINIGERAFDGCRHVKEEIRG